MDGARIFNAATALDVDVRDIVENVDAVMFALSKGLSAPFGAILAGSKSFIEKSRWIKQRLGGGFRQAGFMAAPGIVALNTMRARLHIDHANAQILGKGLSEISGIDINLNNVQTNIVLGSIKDLNFTIDEFLERLLAYNIKAKRISSHEFRMVTHYGIEEDDIRYVIDCIGKIVKG